MYTVTEMARLSGVSVRALHHYHHIGLLVPAAVGENRYRYYGEVELLRLQQILLYREGGVPLGDIAAILDDPDFDAVAALTRHKAQLQETAERYRQLIRTIDRTIARLSGDDNMTHEDLYKGFSAEKQAGYEDWLVREVGGDMGERLADAKAAHKKRTGAAHDKAMDTLKEVETGLVARMAEGVPPTSEALRPLLERHRAWVAEMWDRPCPPDAYASLAELYASHPDFTARHEALAAGFTEYLCAAMKAYAKAV